jgi:hypothetical protein
MKKLSFPKQKILSAQKLPSDANIIEAPTKQHFQITPSMPGIRSTIVSEVYKRLTF